MQMSMNGGPLTQWRAERVLNLSTNCDWSKQFEKMDSGSFWKCSQEKDDLIQKTKEINRREGSSDFEPKTNCEGSMKAAFREIVFKELTTPTEKNIFSTLLIGGGTEFEQRGN